MPSTYLVLNRGEGVVIRRGASVESTFSRRAYRSHKPRATFATSRKRHVHVYHSVDNLTGNRMG